MDLCLTCKKPFCDECIKEHKKNNPGHEIIDINKIDNYCHIHNGETIIAWCIRCKTNLCCDCFALHEERCEYRMIDDIKLKSDELENYKKILKGIISFFYKTKALNNNMIKKCKDNNEQKEINDLYNKYYEINENMIALSQLSILTYIYYQDKYTYPIIQNTKNLCNLNEKIIFNKKDATLEEYKIYLKKQFIIQYSEIEEPKITPVSSLPKLNEAKMKILMDLLNNMNFNYNEDGTLTNYIPISYVDNSTKTNISKLKCIKTIKFNEMRSHKSNILYLNNNRFAISYNNIIEIYNLNNFQLLNKLTGHQYDIFSLGLFKDNKTFASGDMKGNIKIWKFDNNNYICIGNITSEMKNLTILNLQYLSTGNLASLTNQRIEIWKSVSPYTKEKNCTNNSKEYVCFLETKNNFLVTGTKTGNLIFYDPENLSIKKELYINSSFHLGLIELKNDKIATNGKEGIYIVDTIKKELEKIIVREMNPTSFFCLNDNTILTSEIDNTFRQYDYRTCTLIGSIEGSSDSMTVATCQFNDKYIINSSMFSFNIWEFQE
jgi:WD40 repeat protein